MKSRPLPLHARRGMTIIEMTLTMALLIGLTSVVSFSFGGFKDWKLGKVASAQLQTVYIAQKALLADRPTLDLADIDHNDLIPYLPGGATELPKITLPDGSEEDVEYKEMPPVIKDNFDPSGAPDDGIWDIGHY